MAAPIAIKLRCATWAELDSLYHSHIKRGRFLVRKATGATVGAAVRLELTLPSGEVLSFAGRVAEPRGEDDSRTRLELDAIAPSILADLEAKLLHARAVAPAFVDNEDTLDTAAPEFERSAVESDLADALQSELEALRVLNPQQIMSADPEASLESIRGAFAELTQQYEPARYADVDNPRVRALAAEIHAVLCRAFARMGRPAAVDEGADAPPLPPPPMQAPLPALLPDAPIVTFTSLPKLGGDTAPVRKLSADSLFGDIGELPRLATASRPLESDVVAAARDSDRLLQAGHHDQAVAGFEGVLARDPQNRGARIGRLLALGLKQLAAGDRALATPYFESVLEIDPRHERAGRELATIRRSATESRRGLLAKLLGRKQ